MFTLLVGPTYIYEGWLFMSRMPIVSLIIHNNNFSNETDPSIMGRIFKAFVEVVILDRVKSLNNELVWRHQMLSMHHGSKT